MNFDEFKRYIREHLPELLPEERIEISPVEKLQGQSYTGLIIHTEGNRAGVSLNLEEYFADYLSDDISPDAILHSIANTYRSAVNDMPDFPEDLLSSYEALRDRLSLELIPRAGNEELLETVPHQPLLDMELIYRINTGESETRSTSAVITNSILEALDVPAERLHEDALLHAPRNQPAIMALMKDVLAGVVGIDLEPEPLGMWVAGVESFIHGAGVLAYPGFLQNAAEAMGCDFYVLPSSIHELLFLENNGAQTVADLEDMVRNVNATSVPAQDRLSDEVYHFDPERGVLEFARDYERRMTPVQARSDRDAR